MIKMFLVVLPSASLTAIIEAVIFCFLSFNAGDKTDESVFALPFLVVIAYYGSIFFLSFGQCKKCFSHSQYLNRGTRICGAFSNILILALVLALIVVGALADNDLIL
jgi:hypothetical protein